MRRPSKAYIAIDQYGHVHQIGYNWPRKYLLMLLDRQHADKMYADIKDKSYHVGYIIAGLWLTLFEVKPVEREIR